MRRLRPLTAVLFFAVMGLGAEAGAQTAEIAAFGGYGFGGALTEPVTGRDVPIEGGLVYGGTFSKAIAETWRVEALFSRQESRLAAEWPNPSVDVAMERYMGGIQEERSRGSLRAFGTFLIGATRFVRYGFDSETWFTVGLGLGIKTRLATHVGFRFEARGFYTPVASNGALVCGSRGCLFAFSGAGKFQGDLSGGVLFAF